MLVCIRCTGAMGRGLVPTAGFRPQGRWKLPSKCFVTFMTVLSQKGFSLTLANGLVTLLNL